MTTLGVIEKCIICYKKNETITTRKENSSSSSSSVRGDNNKEKALGRQLHTVFLLKKFLSIPEETFQQFQQQYGNPSSWIYWCDSCSILVDKAKKLFDQVTSLEQKIDLLKRKAESKIISSRNSEMNSNRSKNVPSKDEPTEIVRTLIIQNILCEDSHSDVKVKVEIGSASDHFMDNDYEESVEDFGEDTYSESEDLFDEEGEDISRYTDKCPLESSNSLKKSTSAGEGKQNSSEEISVVRTPLPKYPNFKNNFQNCPVCSKSFSTKQESYKHLLTHPPPCPYCNEQLLFGEVYRSHMKYHKNDVIKHSKCCVCYKDFKNYTQVLNHKCHRVVYDVKQILVSKDIIEATSSEESPFNCSVCEKDFLNQEELNIHQETHVKILICSYCGKKFKNSYVFQSHLITHSDPDGKPFKCSTCGKGFAIKRNLIDHENIHKEDNPFRCTVCDKNLVNSYSLSKHMKIHSGEIIERPFLCPSCGKSFPTSSTLKTHEKLHTGDKRYECQYCGKKFALKSNLTCHERLHTGENPYACSVCPERFRYRKLLNRHLRIHTEEPSPHQCSYCEKRFEEKHEVTKHERIHTGEKRHSCAICEKNFAELSTRRRHIRMVHDKIPGPLSCSICRKRFYNKVDLERHLHSH